MRIFVIVLFLLMVYVMPAEAQCTLSPSAVCNGTACANEPRPSGHILYNEDVGMIQYCSGSEWQAWLYGALPTNPLVFADRTNVSASTLYETGIVRFYPNNGTVISISGDGSPEYRICSDQTCSSVAHDWSAAAGTMDGGEYIQLRLTSAATINTTTTAVLKIGSGTLSWNVTTTDGSGTCGTTPGSQTYSTPGVYTFTPPANSENCDFTITVAGGAGGGYSASKSGGDGGGIQFVYNPSGTAANFRVLVGEGGDDTYNNPTIGGGAGGTGGTNGGGASAVTYNSALLAIAGGGGGSDYYSSGEGARGAPYLSGSVVFAGEDGQSTYDPNYPGLGGDNDIGGAGGTSFFGNGFAGGSGGANGGGGEITGGTGYPEFTVSGGGAANGGGGGGGGYGGGGGSAYDSDGGAGGGYLDIISVQSGYTAVAGGQGAAGKGGDGSVTISW